MDKYEIPYFEVDKTPLSSPFMLHVSSRASSQDGAARYWAALSAAANPYLALYIASQQEVQLYDLCPTLTRGSSWTGILPQGQLDE
jgi:hypothetical protein